MDQLTRMMLAACIGAVTGFIAGLQGIAGSFYILTALLCLGIEETQQKAAGTTLLTIVFPISIGAVGTYYSKGDVDVPIALTIVFVYFFFSMMGAKANYMIHPKHIYLSIAFMLLLSATYYIKKFVDLMYT